MINGETMYIEYRRRVLFPYRNDIYTRDLIFYGINIHVFFETLYCNSENRFFETIY